MGLNDQTPPQQPAPPVNQSVPPDLDTPGSGDDVLSRMNNLAGQAPSTQPPVTLSTSGAALPPKPTSTAGTMPPEAEAASQAASDQSASPDSLLSRMNSLAQESSGGSGVVQFAKDFGQRALATGQISGAVQGLANKVTRPIDLYNQAIKSAQQGDWENASEAASKLFINGASMGLVDPDNPLLKAAEALIMHPVEELKKAAESARKVSEASGTKQELSNIIADHEAGNNIGAIGDVIGSVANNPVVADMPGTGPMAQQMGSYLDEDFHKHNFAAVAGDLLGPIMTMGLGKVLGYGLGMTSKLAGGFADAVDSVKPGVTEVAGVKIPQAKTSPGLARVDPNAPAPVPGYSNVPEFSKPVTTVSNLASDSSADKFLKQQVTPAAVKANTANFAQTAMGSVDDLRALRGEPPTKVTAPPLNTVDDMAKFLKTEAQKTYQALDDAAIQEQQEWDTKYDPKDLPEDAPPRPKLFSDLQTQLQEAKRVIGNKFASVADKAAAIKEYPKLQQEMNDFLEDHEDIVHPDELAEANKVYAQYSRYSWLADKLRIGVKGTSAGKTTVAGPPRVNAQFLENLPDQFDNYFGTDKTPNAFAQMMGPEGMRNYHEVVQALQKPVTGAGGLMNWLNQLPFKINGIAKVLPINQIADNLLFNPSAGTRMLSLYKMAKNVSDLSRVGSSARGVVPGMASGNDSVPDPTPDLHPARQAVKAIAASPAATPHDRGTVYDIGPMKGKAVDGMVKPGNIDVNHRPGIDNADGTHSSIFSATIPVDTDGSVWKGDYSKAPGYALVPTIEHGKFMTKDGKLPPEMYRGKDPDSKPYKDAQEALGKRATDYYSATREHLGIFKTGDAADSYANQTHEWVNDGTKNRVYTPSYQQSKPSPIKHAYQGASALAQ